MPSTSFTLASSSALPLGWVTSTTRGMLQGWQSHPPDKSSCTLSKEASTFRAYPVSPPTTRNCPSSRTKVASTAF